jgi:hypothetical protein
MNVHVSTEDESDDTMISFFAEIELLFHDLKHHMKMS